MAWHTHREGRRQRMCGCVLGDTDEPGRALPSRGTSPGAAPHGREPFIDEENIKVFAQMQRGE